MSQIQQPAMANPEDKFNASEHLGALLLFFPTEFRSQVPTVHGVSDAVAARLVNLETGRVLENTLIFPTALVTQLKAAVPDGIVLGRLGQGTAKNGNSAPWLLSPFTEPELARAEAWIVQDQQQRIAQPQAQQGGWGQQGPTGPAAPQPQATGGWGQAPAAPAPQATGGWGAPQQQAPQGRFAGQWGNTPPPAPEAAAPAGVHPGLAQALANAGYPVQPGTSQQQAEQMAAMLGL